MTRLSTPMHVPHRWHPSSTSQSQLPFTHWQHAPSATSYKTSKAHLIISRSWRANKARLRGRTPSRLRSPPDDHRSEITIHHHLTPRTVQRAARHKHIREDGPRRAMREVTKMLYCPRARIILRIDLLCVRVIVDIIKVV